MNLCFLYSAEQNIKNQMNITNISAEISIKLETVA